MIARESIDLGIVLERRDVDNAWLDHVWAPVAVIPGAPPLDATDDEWLKLREGDGWVQYHAATLELEIFEGETEGYRTNLSNETPFIYIVLTPGDEADEPEVIPMLATVCPNEALDYAEDSDRIVEGVPMSPDVLAWVQAFIDKYHVDEPFKKRKRKPYDPRKGDFSSRGRPHERGPAND